MKNKFEIKRISIYAWTGIIYLLLWLIADLVNYPGTFIPRISNNIWRWVYIVLINFIYFEYALPYVRRKRENIFNTIFLYTLVFFTLIILYSFGLYAWRYIGIQFHIYTSLRTFSSAFEGVFYGFPYGLMSLFFFGITKHLYEYNKLKKAAQLLRIEKQEAELNYLRSQTNPHFLFNTLNNIYSLARDKSDLAPESILRLSKILRFMLYETSGDYITIEQEIKIIGDYISLEKLRYDDSLRVNLNCDIEDMKQELPPLLLIPLVENAFKHGVSETRNQPFVNINLSLNHQQLEFSVKNSSEQFQLDGNGKENIGLSNLRRQLELLYTDYNLSVEQTGNEFTATLKINLSTHV